MEIGERLVGEPIEPAGPGVALDLVIEACDIERLEPVAKLRELIRRQFGDSVFEVLDGHAGKMTENRVFVMAGFDQGDVRGSVPGEERGATKPSWSSQPSRRDSNQIASGKSGAVHYAYRIPNLIALLPTARAAKYRRLSGEILCWYNLCR